MRKAFFKAITDERVTANLGTFEEMPVEDCWADLIVIAQVYFFE